MKSPLVRKHPALVVWLHWLNVPVLVIMIWSGLLIYWANDVYIQFPDWFYKTFLIDHRLAEGMAWHFTVQWFFIAIGFAYALTLVVSGEWREFVPSPKTFRDAVVVTLHDLGFKVNKPRQGKFNAAQKLAYSGISVMGIGSVLTGLVMYKPVQLGPLTHLLGGYETARAIHFALTAGYVFFVVIHVMQVARAGWANLRSMVTGYDVK